MPSSKLRIWYFEKTKKLRFRTYFHRSARHPALLFQHLLNWQLAFCGKFVASILNLDFLFTKILLSALSDQISHSLKFVSAHTEPSFFSLLSPKYYYPSDVCSLLPVQQYRILPRHPFLVCTSYLPPNLFHKLFAEVPHCFKPSTYLDPWFYQSPTHLRNLEDSKCNLTVRFAPYARGGRLAL